MAKGVLVAHFIDHDSGSNVTFTKGKRQKKKLKSTYISCVTEGKRHFERKATVHQVYGFKSDNY